MQKVEVTVEYPIVHVDDLGMPSVLLILKEKDKERICVLCISHDVGQVISMALEHFKTPRPLTHQLYVNSFKQLGFSIDNIVVYKLEEDVYHAKIVKTKGDGIYHEFDARPSDAVAVALLAGCPIFINEEFLQSNPEILNVIETLRKTKDFIRVPGHPAQEHSPMESEEDLRRMLNGLNKDSTKH